MTGFKSKKAAALDEDGMYLVHQTDHSEDILHMVAQEREVLEMALEAIEEYADYEGKTRVADEAITVIKEALAKMEQEPVEDVVAYHADGTRTVRIAPQRPWVDLTDEEISNIAINNPPAVHEFARAILTKSKEKNA